MDGGWGSFAGSFADGLSAGVDLSEKIKRQRDAQRMDNVKAAAASYGLNNDDAPTMAPGQSSAPQQVQIPGQMPMPGASPPPPPMAGAAPPPAPMTGGGAPRPPGPAPAPPGGAPPPPAPMSPPQGAGGTPLSATAAPPPPSPAGAPPPQQTPLQQQSTQTLHSIVAGIKKANPNLSMLDLFDATEQVIGQMKGINDATKTQMTYDTNMARLVTQMEMLQQNVQGRLTQQGMKDATAEDVAAMKAQVQQLTATIAAMSRENVADKNNKGRVEAARIGGSSRVAAAGIGADSRRDVAETNRKGGNERAQIGADSREAVADTNADARDYAADRGYDRGVDSARSTMGKDPVRAKPSMQGQRRPTRSPSGGGSYKSADDVAAAYKAGKLTHDAAAKILRDNGWAQ